MCSCVSSQGFRPCFLRSHSQKKYVACAKRWTEKKSPGEASRQEREDEAVRSEVGGLHWLQNGRPAAAAHGRPNVWSRALTERLNCVVKGLGRGGGGPMGRPSETGARQQEKKVEERTNGAVVTAASWFSCWESFLARGSRSLLAMCRRRTDRSRVSVVSSSGGTRPSGEQSTTEMCRNGGRGGGEGLHG